MLSMLHCLGQSNKIAFSSVKIAFHFRRQSYTQSCYRFLLNNVPELHKTHSFLMYMSCKKCKSGGIASPTDGYANCYIHLLNW